MGYRILIILLFITPTLAAAQGFPTEEPVIKRMWEVGMDSSQVEDLAHVLIDQIGPRLAGSQGLETGGGLAAGNV